MLLKFLLIELDGNAEGVVDGGKGKSTLLLITSAGGASCSGETISLNTVMGEIGE